MPKNGGLLTKQFDITTQQWIILLLLAKDPNFVYLQRGREQKKLVAKKINYLARRSERLIRKIRTLTKAGEQVVEGLEK